MSTPVLHHGDQDFDLQELKRFRVERVPSIASLSGEAATAQARLVFAIDEEELYIGRQGVWRPASGSSVSWQSPVASEANLPTAPAPGAGEARVVVTGAHGVPAIYAYAGAAWANILDDNRLIYKDGTRPFTALPSVSGLGLIASADGQLITKKHYDTTQPAWFSSYSGGLTWGTPVANPGALGAATTVGLTRVVLSGTPSGSAEIYVANGSSWSAVTDDTALISAINAKVPLARTVTAGAGLTGGGALTGDISLAVSFGSTSGTVAAGDDARLGRSITVGTGMTGGGSLGSGNVFIGLSFGSSPGTICAGDDARLLSTPGAGFSKLSFSSLPAAGSYNTGQSALVPDSVNQFYRSTGADYNASVGSSNTSRTWKAVASSYDGKTLLALDSVSSQVQLSVNGGNTWANKHTAQVWSDCSMAYDASLMIVVGASQTIYTSTDGTTWTTRDISRAWSKIRVSANGKSAIAAVNGGALYLSTDSGVTWTAKSPTATTWGGLAISGDGTYIVAVADGGHLFISSDSGGTWTDDPALFGPLGNKTFKGAAITEDGATIMVIAGGTDNFVKTIVRTTGVTTTVAPAVAYRGCAMSYDGRVQMAVADYLYVSVDGGVSWNAKGAASPVFAAVATSFDGTRCVLGGMPGFLYTGTWGWELVAGLKTSTMYSGAVSLAPTQIAFGSAGSAPIGSSKLTWTDSTGSMVLSGGTTSTSISVSGTINAYQEINVQNLNAGNATSSDLVATSSDGNATTHFVDMGINGAGGGTAPFTAAHAAYLYTTEAELNLAALDAAGAVNIAVGATPTTVLSASISGTTTTLSLTPTKTSISQGTITAFNPALSLSSTWNSATTHQALSIGVTATLSNPDSTVIRAVVGSEVFAAYATGGLDISGLTYAYAGVAAKPMLRLTQGANTTMLASTEYNAVNFGLSNASVQFNTGAITTQRAVLISAPTYAFVGASTITTAATLAVAGAPVAGTNATITNSYALWVQSGATRLDQGTITAQATALAVTSTWNNGAVIFTGIDLNITDTTSQLASWLLTLRKGGTIRAGFYRDGSLYVSELAAAGVAPNSACYIQSGAHTNGPAGSELNSARFNLAATVQWATGAITTQRAFRVDAPTYSFVGASTITNAATVAITGAPIAGTNATLTNSYALWVQGGKTQLDGNATVGAAGSTVGFYASAGATKQTVTGAKGSNAALASLLAALVSIGLVTDTTTA